MSEYDRRSRDKYDSLHALADYNETREKQLEAKRRAAVQREKSIARTMEKHGINREAAVERLARDPFANINLERASELGLVREHVPAYAAVQAIIERIMDQSSTDRIDISTTEGLQMCHALWKQVAPNLPQPDDWYLQQLQAGTTISNVNVEKRKIVARPAFGRERNVFIDNWAEVDWGKTVTVGGSQKRVLRQPSTSPLLAALYVSDGSVVNISRESIDNELWEGDPVDRNKRPNHRRVIESLGLDPDNYFFRCIPQDTYARLATHKQLGKSDLHTHFDDYFFEGVSVYGLDGGYRVDGGASLVGSRTRGTANDRLAVRLVLECNKDLE